jgi:hypothetical protein
MPARTACSSGPVPGSSLRDANDAAPQTGASLTGVDVAAVDLGAAILAAVTVALLIGTAWHRCCLNRYRSAPPGVATTAPGSPTTDSSAGNPGIGSTLFQSHELVRLFSHLPMPIFPGCTVNFPA